MVPEAATWSNNGREHTSIHTRHIAECTPYHEVLLSCKPHRPGCHQWRPLQQHIHDDLKELTPAGRDR